MDATPTRTRSALRRMALTVGLMLCAANLHAQGAPTPVAPGGKTHSIQSGPLGLLLGTYSLDYEYLRSNAHGLYLGLEYADGKDLNGKPLKSSGYALNYRYHLKGQMSSNFVGVYFRHREVDGALEVDDETFAYHFRAASVGPLYGACHVARNGLSLTWRVGYGVPFFDFAWRSASLPAHHGMYEGIFKWTSNLESGLSVGYSF